MISVRIAGTGSYVPPKILTNHDMAKIVETSDEWITTKTGIKERRIVEGDICTSDLAVLASKDAINDAGVKAKDIDLVILATSSPDVPMSSTAAITQAKLGAFHAGAFDVGAVCSGYVHALDIGVRYAADQYYDNVLVIGSEVYSKLLNWNDRTTCVFFGDGAGAVLLKKCTGTRGYLGSFLKADGRGAEVIEIPAGGSKNPISHRSINQGLQFFHMDGRAVWNFAIEAFPEAVNSVLKRIGKSVNDIDLLISHQANINIIKNAMETLKLPMNKTYTNLEKYGNTAGASIPIALDEAKKEGKIKSGDLVITVGFGGGLAWGANAFIW